MEPVLDENIIDELRDVMGDQFAVLCERYTTDARQRIEAMRAAVTAQDGDTLRAQAHSLKGASANLGAAVLADACLAMEQLAKAGDWRGIDVHLPRLEQVWQAVETALARLPG